MSPKKFFTIPPVPIAKSIEELIWIENTYPSNISIPILNIDKENKELRKRVTIKFLTLP
jgi:hypothetical protein